jgi:hypothetical protein
LITRQPLIAVELNQRQAAAVGERGDPLQRRVDEHPGDLGPPLHRGADQLGLLLVDAAPATGMEVEPDRPGAGLNGRLGVLQAGDATDLGTHSGQDRR